MQVYFSHSYRDVAVNGYFIERLAQEDIPLRADQKTDVWCVAKLERYLAESSGFISIIPRRPTEQDAGGYSLYIGRELNLARRARVPRLLFVDEQVLRLHRVDFPEDAVAFNPDRAAESYAYHDSIIRQFRVSIETTTRAARKFSAGEAVVVASTSRRFRDAARDVADILRLQDFQVSSLFGRFEDRGLDDIRLLEALWRAEICVFLLGEKISDAHVAMALAHAHCIPSIRLCYDPQVTNCEPGLSGLIRWRNTPEMLIELERQVASYRQGLVAPIALAETSGAQEAARAIGTMKWRGRSDNFWSMARRFRSPVPRTSRSEFRSGRG
jgi:hypothetical protein